jgi:hypothetical protein
MGGKMKKLILLLLFIAIPFFAYTAEEKEIKVYGYENTIVILHLNNNKCITAKILKSEEADKIVSCSEAQEIINTFPKMGEVK